MNAPLATLPLKLKTTPWAHQARGVDHILNHPATMLAFDMGCGKSKCIVDAVVNLNAAPHVLVACPKSVVDVWPAEFEKHAAMPINVIALGTGAIKLRAARLQQHIAMSLNCDLPLVAVINYDAVWRLPMATTLMGEQWDLVVCDESHRIKSVRGRASSFMAKLGRLAGKRVCLTGTPFAHSPLDIWAQYRFLEPQIYGRSFVAFRNHYAVMGGHHVNGRPVQVLGFTNLDELHEKFYSIAQRVSKSDVLDLPPVTHQMREVELGTDARRVYDDLEKYFVAEVKDGTIVASNAMVNLLRLQQITGGHATVEDDDGRKNTFRLGLDMAKANEVRDILDDLPNNEPAVVYCWFKADMAATRRAIEGVGRTPYELSGAKKELADWQNATGGEVLVVQIQAGSVGIDLTRAAYCVYYSQTLSLAEYEQSLARLNRPGQTRSVTYIHLIAKRTVDVKIRRALAARKDVIESILKETTDDTRDHRKTVHP